MVREHEPGSEAEAKESFVTAFARGLAVIRTFPAAHQAVTISEVARASGLNRATARRFLHTLVADGYAIVEKGQYRLTPQVVELGYSCVSWMSASDILQYHLGELAEQLNETCTVGELDGQDMRLVARAQPSREGVMVASLSVGSRIPAHVSANGRVLLAGLPDDELDDYLGALKLRSYTPRTIVRRDELKATITKVRVQGYSIVDQERELGALAAAVPLKVEGWPARALGVVLPIPRASPRSIEREHLPALQEAATELRHVLRLTY